VTEQLDAGAADAVLMVEPAPSVLALELDRDAAMRAEAQLRRRRQLAVRLAQQLAREVADARLERVHHLLRTGAAHRAARAAGGAGSRIGIGPPR
jgi:hypothetical protein